MEKIFLQIATLAALMLKADKWPQCNNHHLEPLKITYINGCANMCPDSRKILSFRPSINTLPFILVIWSVCLGISYIGVLSHSSYTMKYSEDFFCISILLSSGGIDYFS
uniref:Uncharacterized protein n=1 Tax=Glossina pallidipes TaxID=7398 RepID=A0A1A9ZIL9_GLOPL